ncbi:MAG: N-formylglutamate amidohydrolase, partial [Xanthomarina sp.]
RFNYPYLGKADGFTSYLRKQFPKNYLGIEIEVNQKFSKNNVIDSQLKQNLYGLLENYFIGKSK